MAQSSETSNALHASVNVFKCGVKVSISTAVGLANRPAKNYTPADQPQRKPARPMYVAGSVVQPGVVG